MVKSYMSREDTETYMQMCEDWEKDVLEVVQKIADGHTDPQGICQDVLDEKPSVDLFLRG